MSELVRLRADPKRIRVSIRRQRDGVWRVSVSPRTLSEYNIVAYDSNPATAAERALNYAARLDGIDLGMEWTYVRTWV